MKDFEKKVLRCFETSKKNYDLNFKSNHWNYQINKKKDLFTIQNLQNFRHNDLSKGLDDQFYTIEQTKFFFNNLIEEYGEKNILDLLDEKNIGNYKNVVNYKDRFYSANELFHIKFLLKIKDQSNFDNKSIVCEIGPGYGSFISKFIRTFNSKVVLIDLPESNFLSAYYLKNIFPEKNFFISSDVKNNKIEHHNILSNDIIIINPWDKLPNMSFDLFINARSMMEMNKETISSYFKFIQNSSTDNSFFLCINRYYKDTVGYPIELHDYPFDENWKTIISETSWNQNHVHFLYLKRAFDDKKNIKDEIEKIKKISKLKTKNDPRLIRRITPGFLYKIYKKIKFTLLGK